MEWLARSESRRGDEMRFSRVSAAVCLPLLLMVVFSSQTTAKSGAPLLLESKAIHEAARPHYPRLLPPTASEITAAKSLVEASLGPSSILYNIVAAMPGVQPRTTIEQANSEGLSDHPVPKSDRV